MTPRKAGLLVIGGAIAMVVVERMTKAKDPGKATQVFIPSELLRPNVVGPAAAAALQPNAARPAPASFPTLVQGDPLPMVPGSTYHVTLTTHRAANAASVSQVIGEAQKRGFTQVSASKQKPAGWPGAANGDFYVTGVYSGAPKNQDRSEGNILGSVDVTEAWVG